MPGELGKPGIGLDKWHEGYIIAAGQPRQRDHQESTRVLALDNLEFPLDCRLDADGFPV